MKKSHIEPMPKFFDRYIMQVVEEDLIDALEAARDALYAPEMDTFARLADKRYAPDKWTVKDIFQHIIDNERVQAYRALRIARNDKTELPGYDENLFAANAPTGGRSMEDLLEELRALRNATILMFRHIEPDAYRRTAVCNGQEMSVTSLGYVIAGHQQHHFNTIRERYFPLLNMN